MAWRDAASALTLALVALAALLLATRLEIGSVTRPGPGFFPLVVAAALLIVSLALLAGAWPGRGADESATRADATAATPRHSGALLLTIGALVAYVALFERLGFVLMTAALLAFLFRIIARYRWPTALGTAVVVAFMARLVFDRWLQVRLPPDFWGR